MARPRKDPAVKALRGTLRKDREPKAAPAAIAGPMVAPVPLSARALEHFDAVAAMLRAEGRASQHHAYSVALLAQRIDQCERWQEVLAGEGETYQTVSASGSVMHRVRPEVAMLADALRHTQALLSDLMLSPTASQRVARLEKPKGNAFAEL